MLDALIDLALRRRLLTLILGAVLAALGTYAMLNLPIDAFPDVSAPQVKIILKVPGLTPEEIERRVTIPIETELLGLPKQTMLRAVAKYGLTDITVDFADGTDIYWARQQVAERLANVMGSLPEGVEGGLAPITTPLGEMFMFTIEGPQSLEERRALLDWVIRPALRTVPGVADVNALGGRVATFEVAPDPTRMAARGVRIEDLRTTLMSNNRNDGAGRLTAGEEALLVRVIGRASSLEDLTSLRVPTREGGSVRVDEVAEVRLASLTRNGGVTRNGQGETVEGLVLGLRGANARAVVEGVRARLDELAPSLPEGVHIEVFYDRGNLVDQATHTVSKALIEAVVLVVIMLVLFLGEARAALAVALILPLAALATFLAMRELGMSANLMSLGGLAVALGMLVDAAVVVVENIVAQLGQQNGRSLTDTVRAATFEVAKPVVSGMFIIAAVFLPLLTLQGLEGKLFSPVAVTIIIALGASLLLSLTFIPALSVGLLKPGAHHESRLVRGLHKVHDPALHWALRHPRSLMGGVLIGVVIAALALAQAGKTFMPTMDEGSLILQLEKHPSIDLDASLALDQRVQQALLARVPEIEAIIARAGSDELGLDPMGLNQTDSFLVLKPRHTWSVPDKDALMDRIRTVMEDFPGVTYGFTQPIQMRVSEMIIGARGDVAIRLFGPELSVLNEKAAAIAATLEGIPGAEDVFTTQAEGVRYLTVTLNRPELNRLGLSVDEVASLLRAQLEGLRVGEIQQGLRRIPLILKAPAGQTPEDLAALPVVLPDGQQVSLGQLARLENIDGPVLIQHEQAARNVVILCNVRGRDLAGFVQEAQQKVAQAVPLEPGYRLTWGGEFQNQQRAMQRLSIVVPAALLLILGMLAATFGGLRPALLVMVNVPLALIGGVLALYLAGEYLSVPASVGFIALLGIAVLNGVVLVNTFLHLRENGLDLRSTVLEGTRRRLRPVMMTATIAALGLVPLLFAQGPGAEIQRPLAVVVIGGLISSTLLTLILLPVLYERFGEARSATPST
ncbi:CusA/CzcA family heavy metal efflux RND transporter [Thiofaba sp. EF100]|uniref:efflux RND transporter permease subunit n=1 Tax=Thiofaba sp. EF100 TaxID=3121274 RepID=UPI0032216F2B